MGGRGASIGGGIKSASQWAKAIKESRKNGPSSYRLKMYKKLKAEVENASGAAKKRAQKNLDNFNKGKKIYDEAAKRGNEKRRARLDKQREAAREAWAQTTTTTYERFKKSQTSKFNDWYFQGRQFSDAYGDADNFQNEGSEAMANGQNLIPNSERTPNERRENAKKAGIASGKARRKKSNLKKAFETILQADVTSSVAKKQLEDLGFEATNEMAIAMVMMQKAMKGDVRAFEQISKLVAIDTKDRLDKQEQRERIKALQLENEKRELSLESNETHETALDRLLDKLEEEINGN